MEGGRSGLKMGLKVNEFEGFGRVSTSEDQASRYLGNYHILELRYPIFESKGPGISVRRSNKISLPLNPTGKKKKGD